MFTGIVEAMGEVMSITQQGSNSVIRIRAPFTKELKVDQSVAHNGVCLTVTVVDGAQYEVVAVKETLAVSALGQLRAGDKVNLERAMVFGGRVDGHLVQGHVDAVTQCISVSEEAGSWRMAFNIPEGSAHLLVHKGSICVNGVSLTIAELSRTHFTVAVIPYTFEQTNLNQLAKGSAVNLEFDVLGKYVARMREIGS